MCEWKSSRTRSKCDRPSEPGSLYCIFHQPRPKSTDRFREALYQLIDEASKRERIGLDFSGFIFPVGITVSADLDARSDRSSVYLPRAVYGIDFCEAFVNGDLDLSGMEVEFGLGMEYAIVAGNLVLMGSSIGTLSLRSAWAFGNCTFLRMHLGDVRAEQFRVSRVLSWKGVSVSTATLLQDLRIGKWSEFVDVDFGGLLEVGGAMLGGIRAHKKTWGWQSGGRPDLQGFAHCKAARMGTLTFSDALPRPLLLRRLPGIHTRAPDVAASFWHLARQAYESNDDRENADRAFYLERVWGSRLRLLDNPGRQFIPWLCDRVFLRGAIGYGTSLRPLVTTWVFLTTLFAILYWSLPVLQEPVTFGRAFYFSVVTFTTLGFGDIEPAPGLGSALAASEAALGGIMMALTVLVIGRKFMR